MNGQLVVKRYAKALLQCYGESDRMDDLQKDMDLIQKICSEVQEIKKFCLIPHSRIKEEMDFINTVFIPYLGDFTKNMLLTAVSNRRLSLVPFLPAAVQELLEKSGQKVSVLMEMANAPDAETVSLAENKMKKKIGQNINLQIKIVPELLGGFRISWQNKLLDMSIAGRLNAVRRQLKQDKL